MSSDDRPSGIRTVSVGFGASSETVRKPLKPAPPYRLLAAGDFGLQRDGERHGLSGRDVADLLAATQPSIDVTVGNSLGSFPATVAETVRLRGLGDLRPKDLLKQFGHHRTALAATGSGDAGMLDQAGQLYDALLLLLGGRRATSKAPSQDARAADYGEANVADGLDALFDLVDAPSPDRESPISGPDNLPANIISAFIAENITTGAGRDGGTEPQRPETGAAAPLLDAQALAFLGDSRLRQVLENWHGLRLLLQAIGQGAKVEITLVQIGVGSPAQTVQHQLTGDDGAMHEDLFDSLLFANCCSATAEATATLKVLAETADAFGAVALATLEPDFARMPAGRLAAMDAPHQSVSGAGFEAFDALHRQAIAARLGVFWNDVLAVEGSSCHPEYFMPAAWVAAAMMLRSVSASGWPGLRPSAHGEISGFPVAIRRTSGREIAIATRAFATEGSAAGLASIGIATLNGRIDRDRVHVVHAPPFSGSAPNGPSTLGDQLVLARLDQLMQAVLPDVIGSGTTPPEKATTLAHRLSELGESMTASPGFTVTATTDEDGHPALDIAVTLPEGIAARRRFDFQIRC